MFGTNLIHNTSHFVPQDFYFLIATAVEHAEGFDTYSQTILTKDPELFCNLGGGKDFFNNHSKSRGNKRVIHLTT